MFEVSAHAERTVNADYELRKFLLAMGKQALCVYSFCQMSELCLHTLQEKNWAQLHGGVADFN